MPEPKPRRWLQLHLSTCIVLMFVAGALVCASVGTPQREAIVTVAAGSDTYTMREYGWPLIFCVETFHRFSYRETSSFEPPQTFGGIRISPQFQTTVGTRVRVEPTLEYKSKDHAPTFLWRAVDPPDLKIPAPLAENPVLIFVPQAPGPYVFELQVTDSEGKVDKALTRIEARAETTPPPMVRTTGTKPLDRTVGVKNLLWDSVLAVSLLIAAAVLCEFFLRRRERQP